MLHYMAILDGHLGIVPFFHLVYIPHPYLCGLLRWITGHYDIFPIVCTSSIYMWSSWTDTWALPDFSHSMDSIYTYVAFLDGQLGTMIFFLQYVPHLYLCDLLEWTTGCYDIFFPQYVPHPYLYSLLGRTTGYYDIFSHS